jgi:phage repressor protein C with HTH and peptisase S24 domain
MRRLGLLLGAAFLLAGGALLGRRRFTCIAVSGHSMEPSLRDGDWLLVDRLAVSYVAGDVVVASDPRSPGRLIVKRVAQVGTDSQLLLSSDHPAHAGEEIGPVVHSDVLGKVVLRYWPPSRIDSPHCGAA